jgi:hypothetical protein
MKTFWYLFYWSAIALLVGSGLNILLPEKQIKTSDFRNYAVIGQIIVGLVIFALSLRNSLKRAE